MDVLKSVLSGITNYYQLLAFTLVVLLIIYKWKYIDPKKDKILTDMQIALTNMQATISVTVKMLNSQNQLLDILIRRYSDDLSTEQLSPFINWMYQSFEFSLYVKFVKIQNILKAHEISPEEANTILQQDTDNLASEFYQALGLFKYRGKFLSDYWKKVDIQCIYKSCVQELTKGISAERTLESFDRVVRKQIIDIVDKILKDENPVGR